MSELEPTVRKYLSFLVLPLLLIACSTKSGNPGSNGVPRDAGSAEVTTLSAEDLEGKIEITEYSVSKEESVQAWMIIQNPSPDETIAFSVRTEFRNDGGKPVEETSWRRVELAPRERHQYFAQSSNPAAHDAALMFRMED